MFESATGPQWLQKGNTIDLVFKETEVSLARQIVEQNNITVSKIHHCLGFTSRAANSLQISIGDEIEALVKANEISLMKKII